MSPTGHDDRDGRENHDHDNQDDHSDGRDDHDDNGDQELDNHDDHDLQASGPKWSRPRRIPQTRSSRASPMQSLVHRGAVWRVNSGLGIAIRSHTHAS